MFWYQLASLCVGHLELNFGDSMLVNNMPANAGDIRDALSIPGSGKSPGKGHGNPLQYSCLENPMDWGAWWAAIYGVAQSQTRLSNFTFTFHFHALEKEMATHSSVLAWRIQGTGEPGGLPSLGSHRVGHDWSDLAAAAAGLILKMCLFSRPCPEEAQTIILPIWRQ